VAGARNCILFKLALLPEHKPLLLLLLLLFSVSVITAAVGPMSNHRVDTPCAAQCSLVKDPDPQP
jgi:hypothetical protein